ncbi:type VII secretion protein EccB [Pseudonocardia spirodelae]|uniref:type VII secretion protein EccB n=1 Tax=Pseudonocardia spirodelae TaxID=3133431 RepID=UPI003BF46847
MQRAPATRDQVDAHRFGVRRLEAALVRADPVPLHEQIRAQRRAVFAGVLLGLLALGVTALLARVDPATDWRTQALVRGERSGVLYSVGRDPARLVPVPDAVAGRLVLAALGRGDGAGAHPVAVPDAQLAAAPRLPPADVPGTVGVPLDGTPVPSGWAVCDTRTAGTGPGESTVLAGALAAGDAPSPSLLLTADGGATYLVHDGRRHRFDPADRDALAGLGLLGAPVRRVGDGLLSAVPEGPPLRLPAPAGAPVPDLGDPGDVVVNEPLGGPPSYYLVAGGGLAPVPVTLADAVRSATGQDAPTVLPQGRVAAAAVAVVPGADAWPAERVRPGGREPVLCATWRDGRTGLVASDALPLAAGAVAVRLAGADGAGRSVPGAARSTQGPGTEKAPGRSSPSTAPTARTPS